MNSHPSSLTRRQYLGYAARAAAGCALAAPHVTRASTPPATKVRIAITFDLEMSRNFPAWEDTHWDYEKGNLNEPTKQYALEAARRVKARGGVMHFFAVGRVFEQEDIGWLKEIVQAGHAVGNHTYDHVNVTATNAAQLQARFSRAPWLIEGKAVHDVLRQNIRMTTEAMNDRLGIAPSGFRTPGGFANGLQGRTDLQQLLLDQGFTWISSKYPSHPNSKPGEDPTRAIFNGIIETQASAQPFVYPTGLIEIPMSPISDIGAFRNGRWKLDSFLHAIRMAVEWAIEKQAVFDFLAHPSCLYVMDPQFKAVDLICDLVAQADDKAAVVTLDTIAKQIAS